MLTQFLKKRNKTPSRTPEEPLESTTSHWQATPSQTIGNEVTVLAASDGEHALILSSIREKLGPQVVSEARMSPDIYTRALEGYEHTLADLLEDILSWVETGSAETPLARRAIDVSKHTMCIEGTPSRTLESTVMDTPVILQLLRQPPMQRCANLAVAQYSIRRAIPWSTQVSKVLTTLVFELASSSLQVAQRIRQLLDASASTDIILSSDFQHALFFEAVRAHKTKVLVIIDALDEASDPESLLAFTLSHIIRHPPPNLRLLLTTRHHPGVLSGLGVDLGPKVLRNIAIEDPDNEVGHFLNRRIKDGLKQIFFRYDSTWAQWPSESQIRSLTNRAQRRFDWASIAADFVLSQVKRHGTVGRNRLMDDLGKSGMEDEGALYLFILRKYIRDEGYERSEVMLEWMRRVLGLIIVAERPLNPSELDAFLGFDAEEFDARHFIKAIRYLLVPGPSTGHPTPHVQSFRDFLTRHRAAEFQIRVEEHHRYAVHRCFNLMASGLVFNICDLASSFSRNSEVADLQSRVADVPSLLIYSSTSWVYHLEKAGRDPVLSQSEIEAIRILLYEKFLYWLEIVSLTSKARDARGWCLSLENWLGQDAVRAMVLQYNNPDDDLANFASDASDLIGRFEYCIDHSIPHIYISLLAFSPTDSPIAQHYRKRVTKMVIPHLSEMSPHWDSWSSDSADKDKPTYPRVLCISFSPSGRRLAAGHDTGSVLVWEVKSGACVLGLTSHTGNITSLLFSPDGLLIASASDEGTICLRNSSTGRRVLGPNINHSGPVSSISFSPESTRIVSGSDSSEGQTIRVWNVQNGDCVLGPLEGHTRYIQAVSYSPTGSHIASGSGDQTIRLWDARSGQCVLGPLRGHTRGVSSLAFSPDGRRLVSGCEDSTLRIWDTQTGRCIHGPLIGHAEAISSVSFSPDGRYVASASLDLTLRIWDAETGLCKTGAVGGSGGALSSVSFSPDGQYLAVGSVDGTVRLWNVEALHNDPGSDSIERHNVPLEQRLTDQTVVGRDGWTLGLQGEKLFWAPPPVNGAIWRPSTVKVFGRPSLINPDLSGLVTGEEWLKCFACS